MLAEEVAAFTLRHSRKRTGVAGRNGDDGGDVGGGGNIDGRGEKAAAGPMVHAVLQPFMLHVPITDSNLEHFDCTCIFLSLFV